MITASFVAASRHNRAARPAQPRAEVRSAVDKVADERGRYRDLRVYDSESNCQRAPMKFYDCVTAPSPRRVRIFLAEKGLTVPTVQVDLRNGEQFTPAFRALNPDCTVPVLELDSGAAIADVIAICRYFEELHPDPSLMGRSAEERAVIETWLRRVEWDGIYAVRRLFEMALQG